jgi:hypothetical protein
MELALQILLGDLGIAHGLGDVPTKQVVEKRPLPSTFTGLAG